MRASWASRPLVTAAATIGTLALAAGMSAPASATVLADSGTAAALRVLSYDVSLEHDLTASLPDGADDEAAAVAQVLQTVRPDVVLLGGFGESLSEVELEEAVELFVDEYLAVGQNGEEALSYTFSYSGLPAQSSGEAHGAGMVLFSQYPIDTEGLRTFSTFQWSDMPGALLPEDGAEAEAGALSTSGHWDVPIEVGSTTVHLLASHPASTVDADDPALRRNHDELRFWADYVRGVRPWDRSYIYDDEGAHGGLMTGKRFVILGRLGADPEDGEAYDEAIAQLLGHPRVHDPEPVSTGAREAAETQGRVNSQHSGDAELDTADLADDGPGNLRLDYVLPSKNLPVADSGVFWPAADEPGSELTGIEPFPASAHRPVWVDLLVPGLETTN
ncbi:endonuclease/exonuclease/phosphatase family protein [Bogoriella caseilytica]|uniref:Endonuclease/exonuclease/phosphatase domain-containing protein n=1 Tax=Bogoriella caseilytica TaxID=56055 RepID=A0A3N2BFW3_9MICO|nr:endonuclease/exonuclease/phosphatase family protein [Bogoriella caseilytica]ROR73954.1 hypothetical protein EDD31_2349 [Bogoriella caseilytica]